MRFDCCSYLGALNTRQTGNQTNVGNRTTSPTVKPPQSENQSELQEQQEIGNDSVSKANKTQLVELLPNELLGLINSQLPLAEQYEFAQLSQRFNDVVYTEKNDHVFHLDLTKYTTADGIEPILKKLTSVHKFKISGLNEEGKLGLFETALQELSDVTFNTIQCDLSGNQLNSDQFKKINTILLSKMNRLTSLNLRGNNIGDAGARAIANSQHLSKLTSLNLTRNNIGDEGAEAIAQSENIPNLTSLDLSSNNIGAEGARAIAQSENMPNLTSLNLWGNNIGTEGARAIAESVNLSKLESLNLCGNNIGHEGAEAIAESVNMSKLTSLNLSFNNIGAEGKTVLRRQFPFVRL